MSSSGVYWAPAGGDFTADALKAEFLYFERDNEYYSNSYELKTIVEVPLIFPLTGYAKVRDGLFRTSQVKDSNNQLDQEQVEFVGSSWNTIKYTHGHYNSAGTLAYKVTTTLRRR